MASLASNRFSSLVQGLLDRVVVKAFMAELARQGQKVVSSRPRGRLLWRGVHPPSSLVRQA